MSTLRETLLACIRARAFPQISLWESQWNTFKLRRVGLVSEASGDWINPWMTHSRGNERYLVGSRGSANSAST